MCFSGHNHRRRSRQDDVFFALIQFQGDAPDIVVYCPTLRRLVTIAWPTHNGVPVLPSGLRAYLRARGLHWACFCAMLLPEGQSCSCRIVQSKQDKHVMAFCGEPMKGIKCGFFMNLSDRHTRTILRNDYDNYPTT
ncbi:hypothetical protein H0H93_002886, partial [Arthromyces matolae]